MEKYRLLYKPGPELIESVDDSDARLSDPDGRKLLLISAWEAATTAGAGPRMVRVGAEFATDLMAELNQPEWEAPPESCDLCNLEGTLPVRFDPSVAGNTVLVD